MPNVDGLTVDVPEDFFDYMKDEELGFPIEDKFRLYYLRKQAAQMKTPLATKDNPQAESLNAQLDKNARKEIKHERDEKRKRKCEREERDNQIKNFRSEMHKTIHAQGLPLNLKTHLVIKTYEFKELVMLKTEVQLTMKFGGKARYMHVNRMMIDSLKGRVFIKAIRGGTEREVYLYNADTGLYCESGISYIREFVSFLMDSYGTINQMREICERIRNEHQMDALDFHKGYDDWICIGNGYFNVLTAALEPYNPQRIFLTKLHINYNSKAKCQNIDAFLQQVMANPESVQAFYEFCGLVLYKRPLKRVFIFCGEKDNGKSTALSLLKHFVGEDNYSSLSLKDIASDFLLSELHNKLTNICSELSNNVIKDVDVLKKVTGGDSITGNRKYMTPLKFVPYAKQIFSTNKPPVIENADGAFWERIVMFIFPYRFVSQKKYDTASEYNKKIMKLKDENIEQRLRTQEELEGLFAMAIRSLRDYLRRGYFEVENAAEDTEKNWKLFGNTKRQFYEECIENGLDTDCISKSDIERAYDIWCRANHKVKEQITRNDYKVFYDIYPMAESQRVRTYQGIPRFSLQRQPFSEEGRLWIVSNIKFKSSFLTKYIIGTQNEISFGSVHMAQSNISVET